MSDAESAVKRDRVLRAMTDDGSFRVLVAVTTQTARGILAAQSVTGTVARGMTDITTSAVLVRETMAPANRVQVLYQDPQDTQLVADAFPEGKTRGLARVADGASDLVIAPRGAFRIERIVRTGGSHAGIVEIFAGDDFITILRRYFENSEQVTSMVDLAVVEEEGEVVASAGYVVQLLPELTDPPLAAMNARLARLGSLQDFVAERLKEGGLEPEHILQAILAEEEFTMLADSEVEFSCPCDRNRVLVAAAALGRDEIKKLLAEEEDLSISCDYCREPYTIGVADYRTILDNLSGS